MIESFVEQLEKLLQGFKIARFEGDINEMATEKDAFCFVPGVVNITRQEQYKLQDFDAVLHVSLNQKPKVSLASLFDKIDAIRSQVINENKFANIPKLIIECESFERDEEYSNGRTHKFLMNLRISFLKND
ncbi:hypothetical protein [Kangiella sp.]|uniref:hypothetical protein n=1 Tax=Kangiella sp. TaxID=1920245 RepID=UPI003A94420E